VQYCSQPFVAPEPNVQPLGHKEPHTNNAIKIATTKRKTLQHILKINHSKTQAKYENQFNAQLLDIGKFLRR